MNPAGLPTASSASSASTVFVVDDDEALREALVDLFILKGYRAHGFGTAESLLQGREFSEILPDEACCVVTDVKMPGVGGIELLRQLVPRRNLGIVLMSGAATLTDVIDAFQSGATEFLLKPIEMQKLLGAVEKMLNRHAPADSSSGLAAPLHHAGDPLSDLEREWICREFGKSAAQAV